LQEKLIMKYRLALLLVGISLTPGWLYAQVPKEDPAHEELRGLRKALTDAINKNDLDALLSHLDPEVVVTWQNGEVSRKPQEVREYYERMMKGPKRVVESVTINPEVDELTHLYGDFGIATGNSKDLFKLTDGKELPLHTHWTAAVVKKKGQWRVAACHLSVNMFDNALLDFAWKAVYWIGGIAAVLGFAVGFVLARLWRKRSLQAVV
jgi:ketosteroid isomerase-like protein